MSLGLHPEVLGQACKCVTKSAVAIRACCCANQISGQHVRSGNSRCACVYRVFVWCFRCRTPPGSPIRPTSCNTRWEEQTWQPLSWFLSFLLLMLNSSQLWHWMIFVPECFSKFTYSEMGKSVLFFSCWTKMCNIIPFLHATTMMKSISHTSMPVFFALLFSIFF